MLKKKPVTIHLRYGIIVSLLVVALGVALVLSCLDIYQADPTGDPYYPDTIKAHFQDIAILVYATFIAVLGGILLNLFTKKQKIKPTPIRDQKTWMLKAAARAGVPSGQDLARIKKEERIRQLISVACLVLYVLLMIYPLIHILCYHDYNNPSPNGEIIESALILLAPTAFGFVLYHIGSVLISRSYQRQTDICKNIKSNGQKPSADEKQVSEMPVRIVRCAIFIVAIAFIVLGITNGSANDVLKKAIAICTECIGLG